MIVITKGQWDRLEDKVTLIMEGGSLVKPQTQEVLTAVYDWLTQSTAVISK